MTSPITDKQMKYRRMGFAASYLAACALHDTVPKLDEELDLEELYRFCKFHSITSIVAMALEEVWKDQPADEETMKKWRQARDKAIRKNILLNAERERIMDYLESIGCWHMPLKGSLLQFDYPKFGMRQMSDNDILFDESMHRQVRDFMVESGYEVVSYQRGKEDEYIKKPLYNIEMHRALFGTAVHPELAEYYRDVKQMLCRDSGKQFRYHFSDEDFYVFMVTHAYKHFLNGGVGIRNLLDVYVFGEKHGSCMDWAYTACELRKLGAWSFDADCRKLAAQLFSRPERCENWTEEEQRSLDIYFSSGTFGTEAQAVEKRMSSISDDRGAAGKLRYVLKRMFPSVDYLSDLNPILKTKPWLLPFIYVKRFFSVLFSRREFVARELRHLFKIKK